MIAKIKKHNIHDIFCSHIHINEEMCEDEYVIVKTCRKCITLAIMNGGTVRELTVNSQFLEELS
jgi:hypothetical protein